MTEEEQRSESYLKDWEENGVWLQLSTCIKIAAERHEHQLDKSGKPYILHPLKVMSHFTDPKDMMAAILHDIIEDTPVTIDDLYGYGIPYDVVTTVIALSRREGETVKEYYARIKKDERAVRVKMRDLEHNIDVLRFKRLLRKEDISRLKMYHQKHLELWEVENEVQSK